MNPAFTYCCKIPNLSYFLGDVNNDPESVVVSKEPADAVKESVTIEPITTKEAMELAIFQLQKLSLEITDQIKLAMYLNLQSNTGMLLLSNKEVAQSGEVTVQDIPEGPEKEDFELYVGEWTSTDLINTMYSIINKLDTNNTMVKKIRFTPALQCILLPGL